MWSIDRSVPRRRRWFAVLAGLFILCHVAPAQADGKATPAADKPPPADWEKYATPKADRIVVHKAARTLELMRGDTVLRSYHIALGRHPNGQKMQAGDGRTPEGTYTIDGRKMESEYHLSLHISYPDAYDIRRAHALGAEPGGAIMIHGQPNVLNAEGKARLLKDWTAGCIALTNTEIDEVWRLVDDGTLIDIYP
jgi:murein L,D-transpeptidase YafK